MACGTAGPRKHFLTPLCRFGKSAMHQLGTGNRLERLEVRVDCRRDFLRLLREENMLEAGADSRFRRLPHSQPHRGRRLKYEQQVLGVFGIADAVVQQVPIQAVGSAFAWMATGAALPTLLADPRVVEVELAFADLISFSSWVSGSGLRERDRFRLGVRVAKVDGCQRVGKVVGGIGRVP